MSASYLELAERLRNRGAMLVKAAVEQEVIAMQRAGTPSTHLIPLAMGVMIAAAEMVALVATGREEVMERMVLDVVRGIMRGVNDPVDAQGRVVTEPYDRPRYDA